MQRQLNLLKPVRQIPLPSHPIAGSYGGRYGASPHQIRLFPAILRESGVVASAADLIESGEASCFFHAERRAVAVCEISGRLICRLCLTEWQGKTVSLASLQDLLENRSEDQKRQGQVLWDDVVLGLAIVPLIMWPVTLVTAPAVLALCILKWRKGPTSIVRSSRWRYGLAAMLAIPQILLWLFLGFLWA